MWGVSEGVLGVGVLVGLERWKWGTWEGDGGLYKWPEPTRQVESPKKHKHKHNTRMARSDSLAQGSALGKGWIKEYLEVSFLIWSNEDANFMLCFMITRAWNFNMDDKGVVKGLYHSKRTNPHIRSSLSGPTLSTFLNSQVMRPCLEHLRIV